MNECDKCGEHALECFCKEQENYHDHLTFMTKNYISFDSAKIVETPEFIKDMEMLDTLHAHLMRKQQGKLLRYRPVP